MMPFMTSLNTRNSIDRSRNIRHLPMVMYFFGVGTLSFDSKELKAGICSRACSSFHNCERQLGLSSSTHVSPLRFVLLFTGCFRLDIGFVEWVAAHRDKSQLRLGFTFKKNFLDTARIPTSSIP